MRIYSVGPKDNVQRLDLISELQSSELRLLGKGVPQSKEWQPLTVTKLIKDGRKKTEILCDLTSIAAKEKIPVFSARAKYIFEPILGEAAQWLPLSFEEIEYWMLNTLNLIDAIDLENSAIRYMPSGEVWSIDEYAFVPGIIADQWLFKIPQFTSKVLVTEKFRALVEEEALTGFFFQPVWDSEHRPFRPTGRTKYIIDRPEIYGPEGFVPNVREYWPPEWVEREKELKKLAKKAAK